jgi:hypothetical protein
MYLGTVKLGLNRQDANPCHRASMGVKQPMARICVRLAPLLQVFRHSTRSWSSRDIEIPCEATEEGEAAEHRRGRVLTGLGYSSTATATR